MLNPKLSLGCLYDTAAIRQFQACLQAEHFLGVHKDLSASHNCYAYKLSQEQRASDDGEPSGTAGQPILSAIKAEQLDGVCVLVTR